MIEFRPVGYVLGLLVAFIGVSMLVPMAVDMVAGNGDARAFREAALASLMIGGLISLACRNRAGGEWEIRQAFLLTFLIWVVLPAFAALPFMFCLRQASLTDAFFEAVSGMTTTGSSIFVKLQDLPPGINLWRGMLNWYGGIGIAFIAMIFLPHLRVGGMQFFRTQGFDTLGKTLPRAVDIARGLLGVYVGLTVMCGLSYFLLGMNLLDTVVHAMATIATGGFSPDDASFGKYSGPAEYAGALFMILGTLPYVRFMQLVAGQPRPLFADTQVRAYLTWIALAVGSVVLVRIIGGTAPEPAIRETLFNIVSIFCGAGFTSAPVATWGGFAMTVAAIVGVIGGCTSSSSGALSVFRVQVLFAAVKSNIRRIHSPSRVAPIRYDGVSVDDDVLYAIILHMTSYIFLIGLMSMLLTLDGVDLQSAFFAIWTSIGNIGYVFGAKVAATGTMVEFSTFSKWVLIATMIMGRLGLLSVMILLLPRFWRG
ncbi:MAG: TrkH family potassium uptake protein [Defluviimonas sp.]|uniref:TrkH family potassium uptake protein n=1 Tax=Albidovulum sp. TaxID=1872424 RepID=UPI001D53C67B|nr:TrkH family potassium uptake protein [Paracoccaceae bacterium]MCC0065206.1 TrkH family potassium uptake protein [Defluviimonas sp.]